MKRIALFLATNIAAGINDKAGLMALFSTHPPIASRIAALQQLR